MRKHTFIDRAALCTAAVLWVGDAFAATGAGLAPSEILRCVNDRLEREFISYDGLLLDYVGEIPTAEEIADLKPNAMGWWCPIENGSMFTGEWLPALMAEGAERKALVEKCVRGLVRMSEVSDVPGFIARGTGTDGKSHHPLGSNDQTDPWFFGLCEYCRWTHADPALKAKALERLVFVARALEKNGWDVPCDGPFKGENRGNLNAKAMPFWGKSRLLYSLKSLHRLTGDAHWSALYEVIKAEALGEIEAGGEIDRKAFSGCYGWGVWIYLSSVQALARIIEMEENPNDRARMRKGLLRYAERVAPLMKGRAKYANTAERPFLYANWRTGYAWRVQKTQKDAEAVAHSGKREILGTRKDYERLGMSVPLCAAAICALSGEAKYQGEILATLRHYDYSTPNISEFFHAAVAAKEELRCVETLDWKPSVCWRGFNLLGMFRAPTIGLAPDPRVDGHFVEWEFRAIRDWGFNFVRLPIDYRILIRDDDWSKLDEGKMKLVDEAVAWGRKYGIHVQIALHRIPGYCILDQTEPFPLGTSPIAQEAASRMWAAFAKRWKGIPNEDLSFNLFNEPTRHTAGANYVPLVKKLIAVIRAEDPMRFIMIDGNACASVPVPEVYGVPSVGQVFRGYTPHAITHYLSGYAGGNASEPPTWPLKDGYASKWNSRTPEATVALYQSALDAGEYCMVGEFGCRNRTSHAVTLAWMEHCLKLWNSKNIGWALWNLRGHNGILDSGRDDVDYEDFEGHKLDRKMLDLLRRYATAPSASRPGVKGEGCGHRIKTAASEN